MNSTPFRRVMLGAMTACFTLQLAAPALAGDVTLYTWAAGSEAAFDVFKELANAQLAPDTTMKYEGPSYDDYWVQIRTRYAGTDGPCVLTTQSDRTTTIASLLAPLNDLMTKAGRSASEYNDAMINGMTVGGELKGLPYDVSVMLIYYNKALFKKYGVAEPTDKFTTAEFEAAAKAISQGDDKGFAYGPGWFFFDPFILAAGHSWVGADGKLNLTDPGVVADVQAYFDLAKNGYATPITAGESKSQQDQLMGGKVGMILGGSWDFPSLKAALGDDLGVAEVPSPDGDGPQKVTGSGFGVAASCPDKEEAFKVVEALTSEATEKGLVEKLGTVPAMKSVLPMVLDKMDPAFATAVANALSNGVPAPAAENWSRARELLGQYMPEGFSGNLSAKDMLQTVTDSLN